jgi:hypothetical protein
LHEILDFDVLTLDAGVDKMSLKELLDALPVPMEPGHKVRIGDVRSKVFRHRSSTTPPAAASDLRSTESELFPEWSFFVNV